MTAYGQAIHNNDGTVQHDWVPARGRIVAIIHNDVLLRIGLVEEVTTDGSILWLAARGASTRIMIEKSEGYEISEALPTQPFGAKLA